MRKSVISIAVALAASAVAAQAQEVAQTNRATELKAAAKSDSATVAPVASGTAIKILERGAGGWARVEASGKAGWIRTFHFTLQATTSNSGSGSSLNSAAASIAGSARQQQAGIANIGVRGISPDEMKAANPSPSELAKLKQYAQTKDQATAFANNAKLQKVSVAYVSDRGTPIVGSAK